MKKLEVQQKKIVVYVPEQDYTLLRSKLILKGLTVSGWFRYLVKKYIQKEL